MHLDYYSMGHGSSQQRLNMRLLYLLLIWNNHILDQLVLGEGTLSPRSFLKLGEGETEVELVSQGVTGSQIYSLWRPPRALEVNEKTTSGLHFASSKSLKKRPTLKDLFQKGNLENAQREEIEKETLAIEKLYNHVMHPSDHLSPEALEPFTPRKRVPKKLTLKQIDQLQHHELINYISNFNKKVQLSKERWKAAERSEKVAEDLLYHKVAIFFTNQLKTEDREVALKNKLKQLREFVKSRAPYAMDDQELHKQVLRQLVNDQKWTFEEVESAHRETQDLKQDAFWLAKKYISSGMKLLDKIKFSMRKFFNFKFNFKWPWKR
ncbi:hypothetical protein DFH28DRAFT_1105307 [Melampsora americana]|nr:hypothetical protein DFH28DRAFT_1105307 [Melampsora americana]